MIQLFLFLVSMNTNCAPPVLDIPGAIFEKPSAKWLEYTAYELLQTTTRDQNGPNRIISTSENQDAIVLAPDSDTKHFFIVTAEGRGYSFERKSEGMADYQVELPDGKSFSMTFMPNTNHHPIQSVNQAWVDSFQISALSEVTGKIIFDQKTYDEAYNLVMSSGNHTKLKAALDSRMQKINMVKAIADDEGSKKILTSELKSRMSGTSYYSDLKGFDASRVRMWDILETSADQDLQYGRWSPVHLGGMKARHAFNLRVLKIAEAGFNAGRVLKLVQESDAQVFESRTKEIRNSENMRYDGLIEKFKKYNDPKFLKKHKLQSPEYSNYNWEGDTAGMIYMGPLEEIKTRPLIEILP